jgi:hypothetical protein
VEADGAEEKTERHDRHGVEENLAAADAVYQQESYAGEEEVGQSD